MLGPGDEVISLRPFTIGCYTHSTNTTRHRCVSRVALALRLGERPSHWGYLKTGKVGRFERHCADYHASVICIRTLRTSIVSQGTASVFRDSSQDDLPGFGGEISSMALPGGSKVINFQCFLLKLFYGSSIEYFCKRCRRQT